MTDDRPNIVVLMADDHRGTEMGHVPNSQARTPVLDALAARGTSFIQAHCQGSMIRAVCVPSRATLMSGRNIFAASADPAGANFATSITIPPELETFPQALRASGYHTHAVGKWHNDSATFRRSFTSGSANMFIGMSDHYKVPVWEFNEEGNYPGANSYNFDEPRAEPTETPAFVEQEGFSTDIFADAAIDFINQDHGEHPFLLYTAFTAPHDPRTPPPGWEVDPADVELPPNFMDQHPFDNGAMNVRDELLAAIPRDEAEVRQHIADYYGMIAHLDHSIGRIVAALEANGLAENTVVIYTGDHGLSVGQHGLMGKQNLYEHSLRVPLVMAGPGVPEGQVCDGMVWHADTNATIRALAGVPQDPASEGTPYFDENETIVAGRESLGAAYEYGQRMYREGRYKLIRYWEIPDQVPALRATPGCNTIQLFDLETDPWERTNLADDPDYKEIVDRLQRGLRAWQLSVNDELLAFVEGEVPV